MHPLHVPTVGPSRRLRASIIYIFPGLLFLAAMRKGDGAPTERLFAKVTVGAGALLAVLGSVVTIIKQYTHLLV